MTTTREAVTTDIALMRGFLKQAQIDLDTMVARNIFPLFTATFNEMWKRVANNLLLDDIYSILETE